MATATTSLRRLGLTECFRASLALRSHDPRGCQWSATAKIGPDDTLMAITPLAETCDGDPVKNMASPKGVEEGTQWEPVTVVVGAA